MKFSRWIITIFEILVGGVFIWVAIDISTMTIIGKVLVFIMGASSAWIGVCNIISALKK